MLISVVIPVYNAKNYIEDCVDSVLESSDIPCEIILVDDGSGDGSSGICDEISKKYSNIKVIHQENGGQIKARMTGVKNASGEYILFLDADDKLVNNAISIIASKIRQNNCDIILFEASRDPNLNNKHFNVPLRENHIYKNEDYKLIQELAVTTYKIAGVCMKAFRASLFRENTDYTEFYKMRNGEDIYMSLQLIDNAESAVYIPDILYYYRINSLSITENYNASLYYDSKALSKKLSEYSIKWFGCVTSGVYSRIANAWGGIILDEIVKSPDSTGDFLKKISMIIGDCYFIDIYKHTDKSQINRKKRVVIELLLRCKYVSVLIRWYVKVMKCIKGAK